MKKLKILLIGSLNKGNKPRGGEESKNRVLHEFLDRRYELKTIDTHRWKTSPIILLSLAINIFFRSYNAIIVSASSRSSYRLFKLINLFPLKLKKTIYLVIGGYFPCAIEARKYNKKFFRGLKAVIVEGQMLKATLNQHGLVDNLAVIPNFKPIGQTYRNMRGNNRGVIKFVFLSSISLSKGVGLIFDATKILLGRNINGFKIEFWGPIELEYKQIFNVLLAEYSEQCIYRGYLDILSNPTDSYSLLSKYDFMLFPTFFEGEGFPGVVLDAYISGLPVAASDWNMNREVVAEGKTGFLFESKSAEALAEIMLKIIEDPTLIDEMKPNCNKEALKYEVNNVLDSHLTKIIDGV